MNKHSYICQRLKKTKQEANLKKMKLVVGLGNPSAEYAGTRHNLGFEVIDKVISGTVASPEVSKKLEAIIYKLPDTILVKPQTFMNLSGRSVKATLEFYKITPSEMLVVHDDVDLELGDIRHQFDRSSAGHKGVESIIGALGTQEFHRLRLGVGRPASPNIDVEGFVLQKFTSGEKETAARCILRAAEVVQNWLKEA
ncbi:MAG TPA: aminoacyl-tRNA hydrolase [Candidatus Nanoarchaeia archaeon]|nr:peptidyl-tRNA hydrolase [uncultured archaeon]